MGYIIEGLCNYGMLLPFWLIIEALFFLYYRKYNVKVKVGYLIGWQIFACCITCIFSLTGTAGINDIGSYGSEIIRLNEINLIPFKWGVLDSFGLIMNIILFCPLGILLPLLWEKMTFKMATLTGFSLSFLIEISQLFNRRATDIDDLLMNTLGAMIGYVIGKFVSRKIRFMQLDCENETFLLKCHLYITMIVMFAFYFLFGRSFVWHTWMLIYE
ncbi:MAG: VanZ family protein [Lachnospiraceae bacterium]|nr:VanZ family protein [Lachnospiraceae bacterium]